MVAVLLDVAHLHVDIAQVHLDLLPDIAKIDHGFISIVNLEGEDLARLELFDHGELLTNHFVHLLTKLLLLLFKRLNLLQQHCDLLRQLLRFVLFFLELFFESLSKTLCCIFVRPLPLLQLVHF